MYLVEYEHGLLLLDSGCRCDVELIYSFITEKLKRPIGDLKLVIVTHAHPDHSGGAMIFKKRFKTKIATAEGLNDWYSGAKGIITYLVDILLTYLVASKKAKNFKNILFPRKVEGDFILKDEYYVPFFKDWRVLEAHGHTDSDISLWHPDTKTAYIADNIVGSGGKYFRPYPISKPDSYKKTLAHYLELKIESFLLAHYGENKVSKEVIENLIKTTPDRPRIHRRNLFNILKHLVKALFKR